ncbi:hypothetical protein ACH5RR_026993 [Cinchona calisaya]|uniref:DUF7870 domain-containing protein n=1 Tax=Cinchona calisaya TaxID=153742 RepID=A0ABD2Z461_9GENT
MDLAQRNRADDGMKVKELDNVDTLLIIKLGSSNAMNDFDMDFDLASFKILPILFRDLVDEGLLKKGHKGLIVGSGFNGLLKDLDFLTDNDNNLVIQSNSIMQDKNLIPNEIFDFVFSFSFNNMKFVDRVLKKSGNVITQLSSNPSTMLQRQPNYRVAYLRRFQNIMVAMRKFGISNGSANSSRKPIACGITKEKSKVALKGLEDALLEPPRRTLLKSSNRMRMIKFLPDLLDDSLATQKRRIFISDEENDVEKWFKKNYPAKNQHFETYKLKVETYASQKLSGRSMTSPPYLSIMDWLRNNVKEEDFVVMKAEAQVVEEMMKEKIMCLVDELFLECKNQWHDDDEAEQSENKRAYWQCLALYGSLRDQGAVVHQWWN